MKKHIHEVYGYQGVYSCINCPKQFTLTELNKLHIIVVADYAKMAKEAKELENEVT